ncbi:hypothetical protein FDECE_12628 [Fusarium decemcellulare]|nr:hypothetical protein FDECE_12628 [Fusarium decemcellulare]
MKFHFVDNHAANSPGSRKAIRRHVMKGKNLGRTIQGRGRKHASPHEGDFFGDLHRDSKTYERIHLDLQVKDDAVFDRDGNPLIFPEIVPIDSSPSSPFAGSEYTYFAFPVQFTPSMRYMVYQFHSAVCDAIYPLSFCRPTDELGAPWFRYMVSDQAFLHCLLAMVATYINLFRKPDSEPLEATRHFSQTLRLISHKLSQPTPPQESTLAIIVSLAIHSKLVRDLTGCAMHLDGLQRLLDLRSGGISELRESNRSLLHKICRTDIEISITQGTRTRWGAIGLTAAAAGPIGSRRLAYPMNQMCETLRQMTRETLALCRRPGRAKMSGLQYQDVLISLLQRLLDFAPLGGARPLDMLDDVWQLSLLAFIGTVMWPTGFLRGINCELLHKVFKEKIENDVLLDRGDDYRPLWLWVMFIYTLSLSDRNPDDRPLTMIRETAKELKVETWEEVKLKFRPFPWIGVVHDPTGKALWEAVEGLSG